MRPIDLQTIFMQEGYAAEQASAKRRAVKRKKNHRGRKVRRSHRYAVREVDESSEKTSIDPERGQNFDAYA